MASGDAKTTTDIASTGDPNDLMYSVKGMYRILDLISEMGSGGLGMAHTLALVLYLLTTHNSTKDHHRSRIVEAFRQQDLSWSLCFLNEDQLSHVG
jgi:hypothetical protein